MLKKINYLFSSRRESSVLRSVKIGDGDARSAGYRGQVYLITYGVHVNICHDLQQNYSDDLRCRGGRGEFAKREMERRTFKRERFAVKNSKGFGHLSRQAARGNGKGKGIQTAGQTNRGLTIHILSTIIPRYPEEGWPQQPPIVLAYITDRRWNASSRFAS